MIMVRLLWWLVSHPALLLLLVGGGFVVFRALAWLDAQQVVAR